MAGANFGPGVLGLAPQRNLLGLLQDVLFGSGSPLVASAQQQMERERIAKATEADLYRRTLSEGTPAAMRGMMAGMEAYPPMGDPVFGGFLGAGTIGKVGGVLKITSPSKALIGKIVDSNFTRGRVIGNQTAKVDDLIGGVRLSDPGEVARVKSLADKIASKDGYIERLIVDHENNVIEGQHRLEALIQLGVKDVPIVRIADTMHGFPENEVTNIISSAQPMRPESALQVAGNLADIISEGGSVYEYIPPAGYEAAWNAAINFLEKNGFLK